MSTRRAPLRQRGFSLVEFMVALLLGTILIGGAISVYLAANRSYNETERSISMLDSGRFSLQIVSEALRHTGFFGGVPVGKVLEDGNLGTVTDDCDDEGAAHDVQSYLFAVEADGDGDALGCIDDARPNTDVLVVKYLLPAPLSDSDPADPNAPGDDVIDFPQPMDDETTYVLANGSNGLILDGADTPPSIVSSGNYEGAWAWPYSFQVFYIRQPDPAVEEYTLARKTLRFDSGAMAMVTENLAFGVEDMRLRFRYDSDRDGDIDSMGYENDLTGNDWFFVGSVEVFLLLRSADEDPNYTDDKTYTLGDEVIVPDDNFWRLLVSKHVSLRNPNLVIQRGGA